MRKINTKSMDLNKETAMRLWSKFYGKVTKVKDFTGREIVKGASIIVTANLDGMLIISFHKAGVARLLIII